MQTVRIIIDQEGGASVGVGCVKGKTCKEVTKEIEKALGKVVADQLTPEYNEVENAKARH